MSEKSKTPITDDAFEYAFEQAMPEYGEGWGEFVEILKEKMRELEEDNIRLLNQAQETFEYHQEVRQQFRDGTWHGRTTKDYMDSVFSPDSCNDKGFLSLHYQWKDKPHRHVADLCDWVNALQDEIKKLKPDE